MKVVIVYPTMLDETQIDDVNRVEICEGYEFGELLGLTDTVMVVKAKEVA